MLTLLKVANKLLILYFAFSGPTGPGGVSGPHIILGGKRSLTGGGWKG